MEADSFLRGKIGRGLPLDKYHKNKLNSTVDKIEGLIVEESRMDGRDNAQGFEILIFTKFGQYLNNKD